MCIRCTYSHSRLQIRVQGLKHVLQISSSSFLNDFNVDFTSFKLLLSKTERAGDKYLHESSTHAVPLASYVLHECKL